MEFCIPGKSPFWFSILCRDVSSFLRYRSSVEAPAQRYGICMDILLHQLSRFKEKKTLSYTAHSMKVHRMNGSLALTGCRRLHDSGLCNFGARTRKVAESVLRTAPLGRDARST